MPSSLFKQQKKLESPLNATNPFLEDEAGEDLSLEKDKDLNKVSSPQHGWSQTQCLAAHFHL